MSKGIKVLHNKFTARFSFKQKSEKITIPIMHCFDNNYVIPAAVSFYSMLMNANTKFNYKLYVLHTDITTKNQSKLIELVNNFSYADLEFINMKNRFNDVWENLQNKGHYSKEVLYKLLAPSIFSNYEKIIVTDVDVVFLGDISESYFSIKPNDEVYLVGVKHVLPKDSWLENYYKNYTVNFGEGAVEKLKVCGGYLVMNLKKLREDDMEKIFINYLKDNAFRLLQSEQDVFNFCCEEKNIKYLPLNNLVCSYSYDIFYSKEMCATDKNYSSK